ncbi:MAG: hypothetical protein Satyrvirus10_13 [Satyrvirus sp.]|uniref:Uncharacterized protein n=1 Tax=Satyrvirus sp. TaxID=2487771 RepID=A0A3G5ADQ7_9VIRU|nr:MAG: hypothetical protein Satyrvirus10_13 [Satyrvirus sp.]
MDIDSASQFGFHRKISISGNSTTLSLYYDHAEKNDFGKAIARAQNLIDTFDKIISFCQEEKLVLDERSKKLENTKNENYEFPSENDRIIRAEEIKKKIEQRKLASTQEKEEKNVGYRKEFCRKKFIQGNSTVLYLFYHYTEKDNFEKAIGNAQNLIDTFDKIISFCQKEKLVLDERTKKLENARNEYYVCPREYDEVIDAKEIEEKIEQRRLVKEALEEERIKMEERERRCKEIWAKVLAEEIRKENEERPAKQKKVVDEIQEWWDEFVKCKNVMKNEKYSKYYQYMTGSNDPFRIMQDNTVPVDGFENDVETLDKLNDCLYLIKSYISQTHQIHNVLNRKREFDPNNSVYYYGDCPRNGKGIGGHHKDDCHVNCYRKTGCGRHVFWASGHIDFLNDVSLDDVKVYGKFVEEHQRDEQTVFDHL